MEAKRCNDCKYFCQHYVRVEGDSDFERRHYITDCGHCQRKRYKTRKPDTAACEHFAHRDGSFPLQW